MRGGDDGWMRDEAPDAVALRRLLGPHVDGRPRDLPGLERREQIGLVDDPASRTVHQSHAALGDG